MNTFDDGKVILQGALNFETVPAVYQKSRALFRKTDALRIDLKDVSLCDSAGLALLVDWLRLAKQHQVKISFEHLPPQLIAIAKVSGVENYINA